jgi:hypothetical protein
VEQAVTPTETEIARGFVACKGFRWTEGMKPWFQTVTGLYRCFLSEQPSEEDEGSEPDDSDRIVKIMGLPYVGEAPAWGWPADGSGWLPDVTDPATVGCLLFLVREAWGCDAFRRLTVEPAGAGWCCILRNGRHRPPSRAHAGWDLDPVAHSRYRDVPSKLGGEFPTEVAALLAALQRAP